MAICSLIKESTKRARHVYEHHDGMLFFLPILPHEETMAVVETCRACFLYGMFMFLLVDLLSLAAVLHIIKLSIRITNSSWTDQYLPEMSNTREHNWFSLNDITMHIWWHHIKFVRIMKIADPLVWFKYFILTVNIFYNVFSYVTMYSYPVWHRISSRLN